MKPFNRSNMLSRRSRLYPWQSLASILLILSVLLGCQTGLPSASGTAPAPTSPPADTSTPSATVTHTPTLTATSTSTHTPTNTATITPIPSNTPTPTNTPTPKGFYMSADGGYSVIVPQSWKKEQEDSGQVMFADSSGLLYFWVMSNAESEASDIADLGEEIKSELTDVQVTVSEPYEVILGENLRAGTVDLNVEADYPYVWRISYYHQESRGYIIIVIDFTNELDSRSVMLEKVYASMEFFTPQPRGYDKAETLTLYGGDPDPDDLDPALTTGAAAGYPGLLFSGLVRLSPHMQIEPDLAESWTVSSAGTVYTFILRESARFASGKPITAQDVKDSWERAADPETESSTAATYLGDILGLKDKLAGKADEIEGVQVIDERTLQVTLDGPKPYFLAKLTYPSGFVMDIEDFEALGEDWVWEPNASGPYTLKEYTKDDSIVFERNDAYYVPPAIRYVLYLFHPGGSLISLYEEGTLDLTYLDSDTSLRVRKPDDPLHDQWQSTTSMCTGMVQMNNSMPPFDDVKVRRAFALAIDKAAMNERLYSGINLESKTILPPGMPGFSAELSSPIFDGGAARLALSESKYAGDLPTVILSASGYGDTGRDDVAALVEMWETNLGVEVQVEYLDPEKLTETARDQHRQMVLYGWCADYPDPENFLDILYHSQSEFNVAGYANPQVDALLEQARTELDGAKRLALYKQAESLLLDDVALIPLFNYVDDVLVNPRIQGFVMAPMNAAYIHLLSIKDDEP